MDSGTVGHPGEWCHNKNGKEKTHEEGVVAVCLLRIPDQGEPQRPRTHQVRFRKQQQTRKQLLDRLRSGVSVQDMNVAGKRNKDSLRAAKQPPVIKPEIMAFQASSFCRYPFTAQSNVENIPPQTPKLPPVTGARALIVEMEPARRSPYMSWQVLASYHAPVSG